MPRTVAVSVVVVSALSVCGLVILDGQSSDPRQDVERTLGDAKFTAAEIASLQTGMVIARADSGPAAGELLTQAAVKIRVPHAPVVDYYGRLIAYVDGKVTLGFGKFSTPPTAEDVAQLAFNSDDVEALKGCRPGKCDVRVGGTAITALQSSIDSRAPDYAARVNAFARKAAIEYVTAYRARGDEALVTYDDRSKPVSLRTEWAEILGNSAGLQALLPELARYLGRYPAEPPPGARDIIYWINEDYGLKPVISIVHGVVYSPPGQSDRTVVAQKYIYASHYYDASLAVASIVSGSENGSPVTYIQYANRSRGDLLRGGFGGIKREAARSQARKAAQSTLETIKQVLEQQPAAQR